MSLQFDESGFDHLWFLLQQLDRSETGDTSCGIARTDEHTMAFHLAHDEREVLDEGRDLSGVACLELGILAECHLEESVAQVEELK